MLGFSLLQVFLDNDAATKIAGLKQNSVCDEVPNKLKILYTEYGRVLNH